jgi:probable F420-dependent oxidoreductase
MGADGFTPLALASVWTPSMRLGTAIIPAFTRGPALMAQSVGAMAQAAPGRFTLGLGTSSDVIVERWNGIEFDRPYHQVRDLVRFLRSALSGEKVTADVNGHQVSGFRLGAVPSEPVPIHIAALREGMLRLAGREADGVILNWLAATDVPTVTKIVHDAADGDEREVVARLFVAVTEDRDTVMALGRHAIAAYLNVPVYRAFHQWLGREEQLGDMWRLWGEGDRKGALDAIPDSVVDELIIWGSAGRCRERIAAYVEGGVTTPVVALLPFGYDEREAAKALAAAG